MILTDDQRRIIEGMSEGKLRAFSTYLQHNFARRMREALASGGRDAAVRFLLEDVDDDSEQAHLISDALMQFESAQRQAVFEERALQAAEKGADAAWESAKQARSSSSAAWISATMAVLAVVVAIGTCVCAR